MKYVAVLYFNGKDLYFRETGDKSWKFVSSFRWSTKYNTESEALETLNLYYIEHSCEVINEDEAMIRNVLYQ